MPRKKLRKIYDWKKELSGKRAGKKGKLNPASPYAFRNKRNRRENERSVIADALAQMTPTRRGGQWKGRVYIAEDFDTIPEDFEEYLS